MYDMAGSTAVKDLLFVGKGACAEAMERAGMFTVADVRAANLDDVSERDRSHEG
jgi:putative methionine-R-sulfoxide reductase with GAF domain